MSLDHPSHHEAAGPSWYKSEHLLCWSHKDLRVCELRAKTTEGRDWVSMGELLDRCGDSKDDPATSSMVSPMGS